MSTVLPITDREAARIHSQVYLGFYGGKASTAPVVLPVSHAVKGRFAFGKAPASAPVVSRGPIVKGRSLFGGKANILMHGVEDVRKQVARELARRVLDRIGSEVPGGLRQVANENPELYRAAMEGESLEFSTVDGMGEASQNMAGFLDILTSVGTQVLSYAKDRYIAKKQSEDAVKLETAKMNELFKQQQKQLATAAKTDAVAAAQQMQVVQQQAALKDIENESFKAKLPLYISLVALAGALGFSIYNRKKKR